MTLQQLEYFVSAAHNLNFSKTADPKSGKRTEAGSVYSEK